MKKELEIDNQRPDEEVILYAYQHPWMLAKTGFVLVLIAIVIVAGFLIWKAGTVSFGILVFGVLFAIPYFAINYFLFKNKIFILTTQRVVNIEQQGLFKRRVQETELSNIYNLAYKMDSLMQHLLNFGDIEITTQGDAFSTINPRHLENPHFVYEKTSEARNIATAKGKDRD